MTIKRKKKNKDGDYYEFNTSESDSSVASEIIDAEKEEQLVEEIKRTVQLGGN